MLTREDAVGVSPLYCERSSPRGNLKEAQSAYRWLANAVFVTNKACWGSHNALCY